MLALMKGLFLTVMEEEKGNPLILEERVFY